MVFAVGVKNAAANSVILRSQPHPVLISVHHAAAIHGAEKQPAVSHRLQFAIGDNLHQRTQHPAQAAAGNDRAFGLGVHIEEVGLVFDFADVITGLQRRPRIKRRFGRELTMKSAGVAARVVAIPRGQILRRDDHIGHGDEVVRRRRAALS